MKMPVFANADAAPNMNVDKVKPLLVTQVCSPVLWEQTVTKMCSLGVTRFVEIGPGKVLSGLVKRITKEVEINNIEDCAGIKAVTI